MHRISLLGAGLFLLFLSTGCGNLIPKRSYSVQLSAEQPNTRVQINDNEPVELPAIVEIHTFTDSVALVYTRRSDTLRLDLAGKANGRVGRNEYNQYAPINRRLYGYASNYHLDWKTGTFSNVEAATGGIRFSVRLLNAQLGNFRTLVEESYFGFGFVRPGLDFQISPRSALNLSYGYGKDYCRRNSFGTVGMRNYQHQFITLLFNRRIRRGRIGGGINFRTFELGRNNQGFDFDCSQVRYTDANTPFINTSNQALGFTFAYEYDLSSLYSIYLEIAPDLALFGGNDNPGSLTWYQIGIHYRSPTFKLRR